MIIKNKNSMSEEELKSYVKLNDILFDLTKSSHIKITDYNNKNTLYCGKLYDIDENIKSLKYLVGRFSVKDNYLIMEVF